MSQSSTPSAIRVVEDEPIIPSQPSLTADGGCVFVRVWSCPPAIAVVSHDAQCAARIDLPPSEALDTEPEPDPEATRSDTDPQKRARCKCCPWWSSWALIALLAVVTVALGITASELPKVSEKIDGADLKWEAATCEVFSALDEVEEGDDQQQRRQCCLLSIEHSDQINSRPAVPPQSVGQASPVLQPDDTVPVRACTAAPLPPSAQGSACMHLMNGVIGEPYECRVHSSPGVRTVDELNLVEPSCAEVGPPPQVQFLNAIPVSSGTACFEADGDVVSESRRSWNHTPASIALIVIACVTGLLAAIGAALLCAARCRQWRRHRDHQASVHKCYGSGEVRSPDRAQAIDVQGTPAGSTNKQAGTDEPVQTRALHSAAGWGVEETPVAPAGYGSTNLSPVFVPIARARSI